MKLIAITVCAALVGCAAQPKPKGGEHCTKTSWRMELHAGQPYAAVRCTQWLFGPSAEQRARFKANHPKE